MSRKLRIEYLGAMYHVMNRGDQREDICRDDEDRQKFLSTLGEGCSISNLLLLESEAKRSQETRDVIAREGNSFQEHRDHLHYRQMERAGAPLGSGAVESLGKQLQRRLRSADSFGADRD
jgi:hypothetical protein